VIAGTLNAKRPDPEIATHIRFVAYELIEPKMSFYEGLTFMKTLGFETVYSQMIGPEDVTTEKLTEYLLERRKHSLYDIDGIVIRDNAIHKTIKEKNPEYAFAFKTMITHESAEVIVTNVEWNVSKDGLIKPIVQFAPVSINNVKIKQASGFNGAFIEKNGIGIGSKITIIRSGEVIPHITSVLTKSVAMMPDIPYEWTETHVDIMVKKDDSNDQMKLRQMVHFSKTLDIAHLGEGTLKKLFEKGIDTIPKLLSLQKADLLLIDGIKEKSAENISVALKKAMENTNCLQLMVASNLFGRGFGERKLNTIVSAHPEILDEVIITSLKQIDGIGKATEKQFLENLPSFYVFLKEINYTCNTKNKKQPEKKGDKLKDMTIVFTGFRNKEWEQLIVENGGKMGTSISKNTSIIVAVDITEDSAKLKKARELNIPICDKDEFFEKYINGRT
jgi:NAD-dependent DNA ligase